ncbi:MAG: hypothetical protein L6V92_04180 [Phocaeicola vulgatus]|nr:MAG: hypothetical protein L6V92_04180 [Phocaeicola vulgatus]
MQENDYTFVTLDSPEEAPLLADAVVVDVDGDDGILDAVMLDDVQADSMDFITMSDDSVMGWDAGMDSNLSIEVEGADISFII